jgi:hypothetical protein
LRFLEEKKLNVLLLGDFWDGFGGLLGKEIYEEQKLQRTMRKAIITEIHFCMQNI